MAGTKSKTGSSRYREQLERWLSDGRAESRTLQDAAVVLAAWKAGAMPKNPEELLSWAVALNKGAARARRQRVALLGLLAIVAEKTTSDGGLSFRALARALGTSPSRVQDLVEKGRETLALREPEIEQEQD